MWVPGFILVILFIASLFGWGAALYGLISSYYDFSGSFSFKAFAWTMLIFMTIFAAISVGIIAIYLGVKYPKNSEESSRSDPPGSKRLASLGLPPNTTDETGLFRRNLNKIGPWKKLIEVEDQLKDCQAVVSGIRRMNIDEVNRIIDEPMFGASNPRLAL